MAVLVHSSLNLDAWDLVIPVEAKLDVFPCIANNPMCSQKIWKKRNNFTNTTLHDWLCIRRRNDELTVPGISALQDSVVTSREDSLSLAASGVHVDDVGYGRSSYREVRNGTKVERWVPTGQ
jgi:hypothetical protein